MSFGLGLKVHYELYVLEEYNTHTIVVDFWRYLWLTLIDQMIGPIKVTLFSKQFL